MTWTTLQNESRKLKIKNPFFLTVDTTMASRILSDSVKQFYCDLELDQRVSLRDRKVKDVQSGVEHIVLDIFRRVEKQDAR